MSAMAISWIAFACIFGGAFLGMFLRRRLPGHHLSGDTKDVVRLGTGLIATLSALVLGLLIGSANSTYEAQNSQVKQLTANIVLLDRTLVLYGPETDSLRNLLRRGVAILADRIWREDRTGSGKAEPFEASDAALSFYDGIQKLSPRNEAQRSFQARAIGPGCGPFRRVHTSVRTWVRTLHLQLPPAPHTTKSLLANDFLSVERASRRLIPMHGADVRT